MSKHSPQILPVLVVATVVGLVCAGLTLARPPKDADKPDKGLPPVGDSSGVIYYWDQGDPYGDIGLVVKMNSDGSNVERLVDCGVSNSYSLTCWDVSYGATDTQPRFFVYTLQDTENDTLVLYADGENGGVQREIYRAPEHYACRPALSQDNKRVAFYGAGEYIIYVGDLVYGDSSGLPTAVANVVGVFDSDAPTISPQEPITWSPDGGYIVFQPWFSRSGIVKVPLLIDEDGRVTGGGTPEIIATVKDPAWSPWLDLGSTTSRIAAFAPAAKGKGYEISTFLPDGTGTLLAVTKANSGVPTNRLPAWSPDGQQIAFRAQRSNGEALMRTAADGSTSAANLTGFSTELTVRRICWRP